MNDQDLAQDIDLSFGDGPPPAGVGLNVEGLVRQGRRVRRGRRAGAAAGAFVVALAVGGSFLAAGGSSPRAETPVASQATSPSARPSAGPTGSQRFLVECAECSRPRSGMAPVVSSVLRGPQMAGYTQAGDLVVYPGTTVLRRVDNPAGATAPAASAALEVSYDGATSWWFVDRDGGGGSGAQSEDAKKPAGFAAWVAVAAERPATSFTVLDGPGDIREDDTGELGDPDFVALAEDGTPEFIEDATILRTIDNPYGLTPPGHSLAVDLRWRGEEHWIVVERQPGGGGSSAYGGPDQGRGQTFDEFVAQSVSNGPSYSENGEGGTTGGGRGATTGIRVDDTLVHFGADGTLEALAGVGLVRQRQDPDLGESFAADGDTSAVAEVTTRGERLYVLARRTGDGPAQYIAVPASTGGPTLEAFLTFARQAYASGEGLL